MSEKCVRRALTYWTTCRCTDCTLDRRRKRKVFSTGQRYRIPADVAEKVLRDRLADGWTTHALSSATGLRIGYFQRHITAYKRDETLPHIGPELARRLLNMDAPTDGSIGASGSRRRLQALAALGHSLRTIADESGVGFSTLAMIRAGQTNRIKAARALVIRDIYEALHMTPGDNAQVAKEAAAKGWPPPLAYDDIDDPSETPTDWHYRPPTRLEQFDALVERGAGLTEILRDLRVGRDALEKWAERNGRNVVYSALKAGEYVQARQGKWAS